MNKFNNSEFNGPRLGRGNAMCYSGGSESAAGLGRGLRRRNKGANRGLRSEFREGYMEEERVSKEETLSQEVLVLQARLDDIKRELENLSDR
nr:DUF5320 family protein [Tissierella sp.]